MEAIRQGNGYSQTGGRRPGKEVVYGKWSRNKGTRRGVGVNIP